METVKITGLVEKTIKGEGITDFIRTALKALPEGEAIYMSDMAKEVLERFPTVKNRCQAYSRVVTVVNKLGLARYEGVGKMTMIGKPISRAAQEAIEFGL